MSGEIEKLFVSVGADTSGLSGAFAGIDNMVAKLSSNLSGVGAGIAAGVGAAVIAVGAAAVASWKSIDEGADKIRVTTGATGEDLDALTEHMKNVGKGVPQSFNDVGTAVGELRARLGLVGQPLEDLSTQMLNLSRITGEDLSGTIQSTTRVFGDWSVSAENQGATLDKLFNITQATGVGIGQLSDNMVRYGAPLRQLGFDFETSALLMGKFEKEGVNTELVMGSMRIALGKMAKAGEPLQETFSRTVEEIKNMEDPTKAAALAIELFGSRAGADMAAAIREGRFEIDDLRASIEGSSETINQAAADTNDFGEKFAMLRNRVMVILEPIGKGIVNALSAAIDGIQKAIEWISNLIEKLRHGDGAWKTARDTIQNVWNAIKSIVQAGVNAIQWIWDHFGQNIINAVRNAWNYIKGIFEAAFSVIKGIWDFFSGLFTLNWSKMWNGIKGIFEGIWQAISTFFTYIWRTITNTLSYIWNAIAALASTIWNGIKGFFEGIWNAIKAVAEAVWTAIQWAIIDPIKTVWGWMVSAWGAITGFFSNVWEGIKAVAAGIWEGIKWAIVDPIKTVWGWLNSAWDAITGALVAAWSAIRSAAEAIWGGIVGAIKWALNIAIDAINVFIDGVNAISGALDWLAGPWLNWGNIPHIPHLAEGAIVTSPTLAVIGDNPGHKEAVIPLSGPRASELGIGGPTFNNCTFELPNVVDVPSFYSELSRTAAEKANIESLVHP